MSVIHVRRGHHKTVEEARHVAEKMAKQLKKDFDLEWEWDGHVLRFERSGVEGELHVTAREIRLDARLGFLLAMLKSRIEAEVEETLDKLLAAPVKPGKAKHEAARPDRKSPAKR